VRNSRKDAKAPESKFFKGLESDHGAPEGQTGVALDHVLCTVEEPLILTGDAQVSVCSSIYILPSFSLGKLQLAPTSSKNSNQSHSHSFRLPEAAISRDHWVRIFDFTPHPQPHGLSCRHAHLPLPTHCPCPRPRPRFFGLHLRPDSLFSSSPWCAGKS
jgi:hypothetical protein